jgi:PAS domain S-box-containing protein
VALTIGADNRRFRPIQARNRTAMAPPQPPVPPPGAELDEATMQRLLVAAVEQDDLRAVFLARPDGTICWANATAGSLFGHAVEAMVGRPLNVLFLPDDVARGVPELERASARRTGHSEDDRWMMRADGSAFWATGTVVPVRDDAGDLLGYMKVLRNRTDLRELMLGLRAERDAQAARQDRAAGTVATFVHELRTPLSTVSNVTYVLRGLPSEGDSRVLEVAELLQRQVERMTRLTDDLARAVRMESLPKPLRRTRVVLQSEIAEAVAAIAGDPADRERIELIMQATDIELLIDRMHLQQMLGNLIGNAVKYTPQGRPIWIRLLVEGDEAVVRVEDRGIGIAPDVLANIFELFTRASSESGIGGSGIGLAVVKELVALNGGTVLAQSEGIGKGAVFILRLPIAPDEDRAREEAQLVADGVVVGGDEARSDTSAE